MPSQRAIEAARGGAPNAAARGDRRWTGAVLLLCSLATLGLLALQWSRPRGLDRIHAGAPVVDLDRPVPEVTGEAVPDRRTLRVAVAPVVSPEQGLTLYTGLARLLGKSVGRHGTLLLRSSYAEINELVRLRRADLAFVCSYAFVQGERDFGMQVLAAPVVDGGTVYYSYLVVPAGSTAAGLLDLDGKRFGSGDLLSASGWLWPAVYLRRAQRDPTRFFSAHVLTGSHDRSVRAVAHGSIDGAAVDSLVYDQMVRAEPELGRRTRVASRSDPLGIPPVVVHPKLDPTLRRQLQLALTGMHHTKSGRRVLADLHFDHFIVPDAHVWDGVRELARDWEVSP